MDEETQELVDLVENHTRERELYEGKGMGSPYMLYVDIRAWMRKYYPEKLEELDRDA